jgi:hypothetical protein
MSLFGYPATVQHFKALTDEWDNVTGFEPPVTKPAKVVEKQKVIQLASTSKGLTDSVGESIHSEAQIHLEGPQDMTMKDKFEYVNALGLTLAYYVKHIEVKKNLGTDEVKKVVVYV